MSGFSESLLAKKATGLIPVIPDFKRISPKCGELFAGRDPAGCARRLAALGAPALSVVTEQEQFGGSLELLRTITAAVDIPVLRKDFVTCRADLEETRACGAAAILLICTCLERETLISLYRDAFSIGLEPLVEAHNEEELALCRELGARLVGINNRNILALERDNGTVSRTAQLASAAPSGAVLVSESGIAVPADARQACDAGADAVLVGTALWRAPDLFTAYREMTGLGAAV